MKKICSLGTGSNEIKISDLSGTTGCAEHDSFALEERIHSFSFLPLWRSGNNLLH